MPPSTSADPWSLLGQVRRFTLRVFHPGNGARRLSHEGTGSVAVAPETCGSEERIFWQESGRWEIGQLAGIVFHNATLWRRLGPDCLELSHLRRGPSQPTLLVELRPSPDPGVWLSASPHLCGPDRYAARLAWDARTLHLTWEVESPTDPYLLEWSGRLA